MSIFKHRREKQNEPAFWLVELWLGGFVLLLLAQVVYSMGFVTILELWQIVFIPLFFFMLVSWVSICIHLMKVEITEMDE
jgi:RsiW-degrading membrane proteinase PrsW (M82 family)